MGIISVMKLEDNINYIVSGLERSGTSLVMQVLHAGGVPCAFDTSSRPPDDNNPRGYFELEGGKIISRLRDGTLPLADYRGRFIKITAYGLKFLPPGNYRVVYTERNIDEVLDSMEVMTGQRDPNRAETRASFVKLNEMIKGLIGGRADMKSPVRELQRDRQGPGGRGPADGRVHRAPRDRRKRHGGGGRRQALPEAPPAMRLRRAALGPEITATGERRGTT